MPGVYIPGVAALGAGWYPYRPISGHTIDVTDYVLTWVNPLPDMTFLVMGVDLVAVSNLPTQWFAEWTAVGTRIYYDSQSIGEGGGIDFAWRGQFPLKPFESISLHLHSDTDGADCSVTAWGLYGRDPTF